MIRIEMMEWRNEHDIVLSRILKYLNGCLDNDHMYKVIYLFIIMLKWRDYSLYKCYKWFYKKTEVFRFCQHLGFSTYEEFQDELIADYMLRVSQIRALTICLGFHQNNSLETSWIRLIQKKN